MKVLFVYDHKYPEFWKDGLWAALNLLEKDGFEITHLNLQQWDSPYLESYIAPNTDFVLGWGGFNSPVDKFMQTHHKDKKRGLCIGGNAFPPDGMDNYDVLFYETDWYQPQLGGHKNTVRAFGVNTDIYKPIKTAKIWDWLTVGSFSYWKNQKEILKKDGTKLAIGEIQKDNRAESFDIISDLLPDCAVSDMVSPEKLALIYNSSKNLLISADVNGGGERSVWEGLACGLNVEVNKDNPKLMGLIKEPPKDHHYYAAQLKSGILTALSK